MFKWIRGIFSFWGKLSGLLIIIASVGGAVYLFQQMAIISIAITCLGSMLGTSFLIKASDKQNSGAITKFKDENKRLKQENDVLKKEIQDKDAEITKLQNMSMYINEISEEFKLIFASAEFEIIDYYRDVLKTENGKFFNDYDKKEEIYHGVLKTIGTLNFGVDFTKLKIEENNKKIVIYGNLCNDFLIDLNQKFENKWEMFGRIETHYYNNGELKCIDYDKDKQVECCRKKQDDQKDLVLKKLQKFEFHKAYKKITQDMAKKYITVLLSPTGKQIEFNDAEPAYPLPNSLSNCIKEHNKKVLANKR